MCNCNDCGNGSRFDVNNNFQDSDVETEDSNSCDDFEENDSCSEVDSSDDESNSEDQCNTKHVDIMFYICLNYQFVLFLNNCNEKKTVDKVIDQFPI